LLAKTSAISRCDIAFLTCLGHLGQSDTNRNNLIYVILPRVAKASTSSIAIASLKHFASLNEP
jgi:hypothetical protein